jgi:hypothetical protein
MVLYDDGEFVVVWEEKSPPQSGPVTATASHNSAGSRFNSMQSTVGDLTGLKIGVSPNPVQPAKGVGDLIGQPLGAYKPPITTVEATANSPPVTHRINGKLDLSQPTVGDLSVRGHTSMGTISIEPSDITLHPRTIRMCSR